MTEQRSKELVNSGMSPLAALSIAAAEAAAPGGGSLSVDNGVDPPAEVTTLVAPGAVIAGGTATLALALTLLGPFHVAFDDPGVGSDFVVLATLDPGVLVLNTFMTVTASWSHDGGGPTTSSFYLSVGGFTTADYSGSAAGTVGGEPRQSATDVGYPKAAVWAGAPGSGTDLEFQGYPDAGAFTGGEADIYVIIATPA